MKKPVLLFLILCLFLTGCGKASVPKSVSLEIYSMDTHMLLTVYLPEEAGSFAGSGLSPENEADQALHAAENEIVRLDALLSTGDPDSEVSRINRQPSSVVLSDDTRCLLEQSLSLYKETGGAFDITVYPLMELWGFASKEFHVPSDAELSAVLSRTGSDGIHYDAASGTVSFLKEGMAVDFGGIGKGYASDRAAKVLSSEGVRSALINLGGNVKTLGYKPDGSPFRVAIRDPEDANGYLGVLSSHDEAVVTSGSYERYFEQDGVIYHHILDPATGRPAESGLRSVTVITESGTLADGLSTSLFVMGPEKAASLWRERKDFEMILFTADGELLITPGAAERFETDRTASVLTP